MQVTTSWEERGMEKERQTIALNLLRQGLSMELIAQATSLTIAQLRELQDQLN